MIYGLIAVLLMVGILAYFKIADRYNIIDKPNERSSHTSITIRGGGVVFPIAILLWFLFFGYAYPWFSLGVLLIATISFLDDIYTLSTKPRLAIHLLSVALMIYELGIFAFPWFWWLIAFVLIIGWINAFNFMDGINGITAFYALAVLMPMAYLNLELVFVAQSLIYVTGIAALVLAFFNARRKARTFAGDVGSVSLALILAFLMVKLIMSSGHWEYILLFAVYGVDAVLTIVHRLSKKENIFKPHRSHLYQYLANERGIPHVAVAGLYALAQLAVSFTVILTIGSEQDSLLALALLGILSLVYVFTKSYLLRRHVAAKT